MHISPPLEKSLHDTYKVCMQQETPYVVLDFAMCNNIVWVQVQGNYYQTHTIRYLQSCLLINGRRTAMISSWLPDNWTH